MILVQDFKAMQKADGNNDTDMPVPLLLTSTKDWG